MILKFDHEKKTVEIDMQNYVKDMLNEFPVKLSEKDIAATPATNNLYLDGCGKQLNARKSEIFHRMVAKGLFICKCGRPDIQLTIAALCTRVADAHEGDWK